MLIKQTVNIEVRKDSPILDTGFVLTTLLGLISPKGLDMNRTLGSMLGVHLPQ